MSFGVGPSVYDIPGASAASTTIESGIPWGKEQVQVTFPATIVSTAVDAGNTPTTLLRPGLALGQITATKKLKEWNGVVSSTPDGSENLFGFLLDADMNMLTAGVAADRWTGKILVGGNIKANRIIVPGASTYGLAGATGEFLLRALMTQNGRFRIDDNLSGSSFAGYKRVVTKAANYTVTTADNDTLFVAITGAVTFTLPAAVPGLHFKFYNAVDANMAVTAPAGTFIVDGNAAATTLTASTSSHKIGASIEVTAYAAGAWIATTGAGITYTVS